MTVRRAPGFLSRSSSSMSLMNCSRTVTDCMTTAIRASSLLVPTLALIMTSLMNAPSTLCVSSSAVSGYLPFLCHTEARHTTII